MENSYQVDAGERRVDSSGLVRKNGELTGQRCHRPHAVTRAIPGRCRTMCPSNGIGPAAEAKHVLQELASWLVGLVGSASQRESV